MQHRRIDIIVTPHNEFYAALVYFTGSGHFNRSMRHMASKMKMSLNEHGLYTGVLRNVKYCSFLGSKFLFLFYFKCMYNTK